MHGVSVLLGIREDTARLASVVQDKVLGIAPKKTR
jgi:hypothetical protein